MKIDKKNKQTTYDQLMEDPEFKELYEVEYAKFEAQEQLLELMDESAISVRALAEKSGVSKTTVQKLRKGAFETINLGSIMKITKALGKDVQIKIV